MRRWYRIQLDTNRYGHDPFGYTYIADATNSADYATAGAVHNGSYNTRLDLEYASLDKTSTLDQRI